MLMCAHLSWVIFYHSSCRPWVILTTWSCLEKERLEKWFWWRRRPQGCTMPWKYFAKKSSLLKLVLIIALLFIGASTLQDRGTTWVAQLVTLLAQHELLVVCEHRSSVFTKLSFIALLVLALLISIIKTTMFYTSQHPHEYEVHKAGFTLQVTT